MIVNIDFESRSAANIKEVGLYVCAAHSTTGITCCAYSFDNGPVSLWLSGEPPPRDMIVALRDPTIEWHAWNAVFERVMWREVWARPGMPMHDYGFPDLEQWHCSMARAALYGLPLELEKCAVAINIPERKDIGGKALMLKMSKPRGYDVNGKPLWRWEPEELAKFGKYCQNDVEVERAIAKKLNPMPPLEREIYLLDQKINDRGILLDRPLAEASNICAKMAQERADVELDRITAGAVQKTSQLVALKSWICGQGVGVSTLNAGAIEALLRENLPSHVRGALVVRAEAARSSVAKIESMLRYAGADNRMRGLLQYSGAATGRWSGRGPQPQNFPRGTVENAEKFLPLVRERALDDIALFEPPMDVLSSLIRAQIIPMEGHMMIAGDFSAIEARVLGWLAGQANLLKMFREGQDPYVAMAAGVYHVPPTEVTKVQRQLGKKAVLAGLSQI